MVDRAIGAGLYVGVCGGWFCFVYSCLLLADLVIKG
jgi:hypothetical protein